MKQILPICCICEKVRDDERPEADEGVWQDMKTCMVSRGLRTRNTAFAYGCCPDCLTTDPRASAFRTRRPQSGSSIRDDRELLR